VRRYRRPRILLKIAITGACTVARSEVCSSGVAPFCTQAKKSLSSAQRGCQAIVFDVHRVEP
jgi:hypothetical protein